MKASIVRMAVLVGLLAVSLVISVQAGPPARDAAPDLPTPQLIEAAQAKGEIDAGTANLYLAYALGDYEKLPAQYRGAVPWDGTLPLLHLREAMKTMTDSLARTEVAAILSEICSDSWGNLPNTYDSTHFYIQYNSVGGGLTIDSYATSLETALNTEVTTFGWAAAPVLLSNPPPGNRYHVRIDNLATNLYGYVSTVGTHAGCVGDNPNTLWNDVDAYATCMVLNWDYAGFGSAQQALDATAAHEFNHSIQFGYGALTGSNAPDDSFAEGGATWMEDEVFDSANDNYNYLWPTFAMCMGEYTDSPYRYWITFRGLTERYGTGIADGGEQVMQDFWEATSKSASGKMLPALNTALVNKGTNLADAYHAYAIAVKFNKTCGGGYVYPYCFKEAAGYLAKKGATAVHGTIGSVGGSYAGSVPDSYALNWISLPASGAPYPVTLRNTSTGGTLRGSVVCDTGSALSITPFPATVGAGASTSLASYNPAGCSSVVAVVTNQAQTADNPTSCVAHSYRLETAGGIIPPDYRVYLPLTMKAYSSGRGGGISNGNFESGRTDWVEFSTHGWALIMRAADLAVAPHGGTWAAWLGGGNNEFSSLQQQVTVPAGSPHLAYWHWIISSDRCGYDFGRVVVNGTTVDEYDLCRDTSTGGWVMYTVDLSAYAGQSVSLQIEAETDSSYASSLFVDDVSFQ